MERWRFPEIYNLWHPELVSKEKEIPLVITVEFYENWKVVGDDFQKRAPFQVGSVESDELLTF